MRPYHFCLVAAVVAALVGWPASAGEKTKGDKGQVKLSPEEERVFELTNETRKENKLLPYKLNPLLTKLAREHSENMARQNTLSHTLDDKGPAQRLKEGGYAGIGWGENIYGGRGKGTRVAEEAQQWWMTSEGHRKNILSKGFREVGVGIVRSERGLLFFTVVFGNPPQR